ncbi:DNA methyltransferase, partial [Francisella tularensis subsp. holarctica]
FLLDIITFLQISFSTNIFRINYNSWIVNVADIKDYDILAKNPNKVETIEHKSPTQLVNEIKQNTAEINKLMSEIESIIQ